MSAGRSDYGVMVLYQLLALLTHPRTSLFMQAVRMTVIFVVLLALWGFILMCWHRRRGSHERYLMLRRDWMVPVILMVAGTMLLCSADGGWLDSLFVRTDRVVMLGLLHIAPPARMWVGGQGQALFPGMPADDTDAGLPVITGMPDGAVTGGQNGS